MLTRELKREEWKDFFDDFSKEHEGWIVAVEVLGSDLGDQEEANGLPLVGISADVKDRESRLVIMVGADPNAHVERIIDNPKHVWIKQPEEEAHEAVEVESGDGTVTLVRFRHVLPEEGDRQLPEVA